jgi:hypothetical protein
MTDLVTLYNPANAAGLTPEQTEGLQSLTSAQIKELATAYPNARMQRAYLLIIDSRKPVEKQLPALSTFENLYNVRERNGMGYYVAYQFKGNYKPAPITQQRTRVSSRPQTEVLDLSDTELMALPGLKTGNEELPTEEVQVTKVKRGKKKKTDETTSETNPE